MTPPVFPLRAVAALFLERQHLDRPRARRLSAARLTRFAQDVGGLQMDSINVVERAHYLTVWSRFGPYSKPALDRLVYRRRLLFEYWAHAACLLPAADYPAWRRAMLDYRIRHTGWGTWLRKNRALLAAVEGAIAERGPLGNADFERPAGQGEAGGWWSWKPATHMLHHLWMTGRTLVHSRVHFQKRFDLAERVMPQAGAVEPPATAEFGRWHLRRALHALGAATEGHLRGYWTFPRTEAAVRRRVLGALVKDGDVVEIAVEDHRGRWYALAEDLPALAAAVRRRRASRGGTLLSPFDSFLWDRGRVAALFGFDYRIEVYTPGNKRVHGYYSMPILHDGQLIGRLDPKTHREERRLEVRNVHFEDWFVRGGPVPAAGWGRLDADAALAWVADSLRSLATFVGAERVTLGRVTPGRWKAALAARLREAPVEAARRGVGQAETVAD